jgi:acetyltransferase-like isoleucine patch superfamily enzyme
MPRFSGVESKADQRSAQLGFLWRVLRMRVRGVVTQPLLGRSGGPVFRGRRVALSGARYIRHAGRLVIEDGAEVQGLSRRGLVFGSEVSIGAGTRIRPTSYYGGEIGEGLVVGDRSSMGSDCFLGCSGWIVIGDDVMLGPAVRVYSENHRFESVEATIKSQGVERGVTVIEDDCWIGSGATITSGITVGRGSVVAAGSVVTKNVPPYSVVAGVPARVLRRRGRPAPGASHQPDESEQRTSSGTREQI